MTTIIIALAGLLISASAWSAPKVSDSLVKNLSCDKVTPAEIYSHMDTSQFSAYYHQTVENWPFSVGMYDIANCWSLSHTQRMLFYLARWNTPNSPYDPKTQDILDMIRGSMPYAGPGDNSFREVPLSRLRVFGAEQAHFDLHTGVMGRIFDGITQRFANNQTLVRNFRTEIEHYQTTRFHQFMKNLKYVIGTGSRSERLNRQTRDNLIHNLEQNRLTLIILRPSRTKQHVVLAKHFEVQSNGDIEFTVYDSNQPLQDQHVIFKKDSQDFFAPEVISAFVPADKTNTAIGVYVVDDEDRGPIEKALVNHYTVLCGSH